MGTEHPEHDKRIADAIRSMADEDGQLTSPPANLWGRIERALDDPADDPGLVPPPDDLWERIADDVRLDGGAAPATPPSAQPHRRTIGLIAAAVLLIGALAAAALVVRAGDRPSTELVARASLTGAGLDPGGDSTGSAELLEGAKGWKVAIRASDLPDLPEGSYYEAWLLGSGPGQVQTLGALEGDGSFAVPEGLAIDEFPLVDVSIEPIDGNPAHSAKSVLRGELERV